MDVKLELEKVYTAMNSGDVCTKSLPGNKIRELCRLARVYVCYNEGTMGDDPKVVPESGWMSRADVTNSKRAAMLILSEGAC